MYKGSQNWKMMLRGATDPIWDPRLCITVYQQEHAMIYIKNCLWYMYSLQFMLSLCMDVWNHS